MKINKQQYETIWINPGDPGVVQVIDQRMLPFRFTIVDLDTVQDVFDAIRNMVVRGAPLIGATAGMGMYLAVINYEPKKPFDRYINEVAEYLKSSRPTAVNLSYAIDIQLSELEGLKDQEYRIRKAREVAFRIIEEERENCRLIGKKGIPLIEEISNMKNGETVNILTHCNAGWLASIDYGTATAPIYEAFNQGIDVHVWVDETRPRNQGARLTAWELGQHGVPHTIIADNSGGHLMQHGKVDLVLVGSDRTTFTGDVANKIGTYLKALAAKDNDIPFYVALPSSTIDWNTRDGLSEIPIEERDEKEIKKISGYKDNQLVEVRLTPEDSPAANYAFDVTPARLVTGLITERGICQSNEESIKALFGKK
jgi:methylthioribose-1-phosphate isomerase